LQTELLTLEIIYCLLLTDPHNRSRHCRQAPPIRLRL